MSVAGLIAHLRAHAPACPVVLVHGVQILQALLTLRCSSAWLPRRHCIGLPSECEPAAVQLCGHY